mmetsp:Transcript_26377/g.57142  ORF Transcript_26377/g.57142 Transcript_26377/m.57142 type:complete len:110 (+) Transcript_26377:37-366(+)
MFALTSPQLVIGLNPPFGERNMMAVRFIDHAAEFKPRVICLIVPESVQPLFPDDYRVAVKDVNICGTARKPFYYPGSTDVTRVSANSFAAVQFNTHDRCGVFILVRKGH